MNPTIVSAIDHEERFAGRAQLLRSAIGCLGSALRPRPSPPLFEDLMEDQTAILTGSLQADLFETQMRGYNRRQVEEYIARSKEQIGGLETRLAVALDVAERARLEVAAVREQLEQQQAITRPAHEEVSERLSQILRLATEEAEQERGKAEAEITRMRERAGADIEGLLAQARAEAEAALAATREEAEAELGYAREEAQRLLMSSQQEAEYTLTQAQEHADRLRAQAERRAGVINGVLDQRLAVLTEAHGTAVGRLSEIRDTIGGLLVADAGATLADVAPAEQPEMAGAASVESPAAYEEAAPATAIGDALVRELSMTDQRETASTSTLPYGSGSVVAPGAEAAGFAEAVGSSGTDFDAEAAAVTADDVVAAEEAAVARHAEVDYTGQPITGRDGS
jgi:cell division septum initiation protein DivIVA